MASRKHLRLDLYDHKEWNSNSSFPLICAMDVVSTEYTNLFLNTTTTVTRCVIDVAHQERQRRETNYLQNKLGRRCQCWQLGFFLARWLAMYVAWDSDATILFAYSFQAIL
jgi:hypothetical protein